MKILIYPDWRGGDYQRSLVESLGEEEVEFLGGSTAIPLPILRDFRKLRKVDIVHIHWLMEWIAAGNKILMPIRTLLLLPQLLLLKYHAKIVLTAHDRLSQDPAYPRVEIALRHIVIRFVCDTVILHCTRAGDLIVDSYNLPDSTRSKMTVIPHPHFKPLYPDPPSKADARNQLGMDQVGGVTYLHFGRMQKYKGSGNLIRAFNDFAGEDDRLLLVGDPNKDHFKEELELAKSDDRIRTEFGYVENGSVPTWFAASDAVILPYQRILTSGPVVLAMMFSRAVIAPKMGCIPCQVPDDGGILYNPPEIESVFDEVKSADLETMGKQSEKRCGDLNWERFASDTIAVYDSIIDQS